MLTWVLFAIVLVSVDMGFRERSAVLTLGETGEGSLFRQAVYAIALMSTVCLIVYRQSYGHLVRLFPLSLIMLFCWAGMTLTWSPVPDIGARKLILTLVVAAIVLSLASIQTPEKLFARYRAVVVTLTLLGVVLAAIMPELAIHQPDDTEQLIVGDWRGIFYHKNIFGSVVAPAALIAFYERLTRPRSRRYRDTLTILFLLGALWMSGSKAALGLTAILMVLIRLMLAAHQRGGGVAMLLTQVYIGVLVIGSAVMAWLSLPEDMTYLKDEAFTGRGYIWRTLLTMAEGRTMLGFGYQSVFQTGAASPLASFFSDRFLLTLPHAHSAYVELLITIGWIGLAIAVLALIVAPLAHVLRACTSKETIYILSFALLLLTWLHGLLESGLFDRDRIMWIVWLMACGGLRQMTRTRDARRQTASKPQQEPPFGGSTIRGGVLPGAARSFGQV